MKWIKASERLPEKRGESYRVIVRGSHTFHPFLAYGFRNYDYDKPTLYIDVLFKSFVSVDGEGNFHTTYPIDFLEWLDESETPSPDTKAAELVEALELWQTFDARFHTAIDVAKFHMKAQAALNKFKQSI